MQFMVVHGRYRHDIEAEFRSRIRCPHLAKDLTQDFYVRLLEKPLEVEIEDDEEMVAYLRTTIRNFIADFWGSKETRFQSEIAQLADHLAVGIIDPIYEQELKLEALRDVLPLLSSDERQVIQWSLEGRTVSEMARLSGLSRTACDYRYARTIENVRRLVSST